jgi:hypothetical protein
MMKLFLATAAALALSCAGASAQVVYVTPGYGAATYVAPSYTYGYTYAVPAPGYVVAAPAAVPAWNYATPLYNYAPAYGAYEATTWGW